MLHRLLPAVLVGALLGSPSPGAPGSTRVVRRHALDDSLPSAQLARAKQATERYRDVRNAVADGYMDINVVIPNMGRHFLKHALLDATFEVERPEILVYAPDQGGDSTLQLVAVEYAVPESLSVNAPEGFEGSADHWYVNQAFGIWTLHAWVWKENPAGIFYPTNPDVQ